MRIWETAFLLAQFGYSGRKWLIFHEEDFDSKHWSAPEKLSKIPVLILRARHCCFTLRLAFTPPTNRFAGDYKRQESFLIGPTIAL